MYDLEENNLDLETKKIDLLNLLESGSKFDNKLKGKTSNVELILEERLKESELKLVMSLERNVELEKDLVKENDEFIKSLKWATFSKLLYDMTNQRRNERKVLGYVNKTNPPYNPHNKYVSVSNNLLCLH